MKCKRIIKVVSALALTLALLVSSGVVSFAASYTTTTNYLNQGTIEVTSRAFLSEGDMATYVAYNGDGFSEANAVYIDQATADDTGIVEFTYQTDSDNVKAKVLFGGTGTTEIPDVEGYEIAVTVNGELFSTEVVHTVDRDYVVAEGEEDILAREIPVSLVAGQAVNTVEFIAEGATAVTPVDAWYVKDDAIVVLSNVIRSNGTLAITTGEAEVSVRLGDVVADTGKITAFAKAFCADDADYGIIIAKEDADISAVSAADEFNMDTDYSKAVKFSALGKGADGGFCVEVQDDQLVAGTAYKVAAYAVDKVTATKPVTAQ